MQINFGNFLGARLLHTCAISSALAPVDAAISCLARLHQMPRMAPLLLTLHMWRS
jgi:hypothetical protein